MLLHGKLRVGTLHNFRRVEEYGGAVGDIYEGTSTIQEHIDYAEWPQIEQHPMAGPLFKVSSRVHQPNVTMTNVTFAQSKNAPNYYVYCMTREPSVKGMREFGNDACVRIGDPRAFARTLTRELERRGLADQFQLGACVYGDRDRSFANAQCVPPLFLKSYEFEYQVESRIVWKPTSRPLPEPYVDLECPNIREFLTMHELSDVRLLISVPSRHTLELSDEKLFRGTYEFVDNAIEPLERFRSELRPALIVDLLNQARSLIREYANPGLRDPRLESAVKRPDVGFNYVQIPASIQRLAEYLEIRLAKKIGRPLTLEQRKSYRFWYEGPSARGVNEDLVRSLILQAYDAELTVTPAPAPPEPSPGRADWYVLNLGPEATQALSWLVKAGAAPPSEIVDRLTASKHPAHAWTARFPS